jgi:heterodisulfide reductase subunit D
MEFEKLQGCKEDIYRCCRCGSCARPPNDPLIDSSDRTCPEWEMYRFLSHSGLGVSAAARALLEGRLEVSDELVKALYNCVLCENCFTACDELFRRMEPMLGRIGEGIDTPKIVRAMRADIVKAGIEPPERYKRTATLVEKSHNRFGRKQAERPAWIPEGLEIPRKGKLLYYAGCVASYRSREIAQSFAKILDKAGVEFAILGEDEWCCGGPQLLDAGFLEPFQVNAEHNVKAIKDAGAVEVVTTCADCYRALKFDYPEVVGELGFTVIHSSELLARLLGEGKIKLENKLNGNGKVTYHDPCQLAKVGNVCDQPREIIESIPGIEFVEMYQGNREYTMCCGRYPFELPELSTATALDRVRDAQAVGAKTIITACSFCKWNLHRASGKIDPEIRVVDIVEVVAQSMES